MISKKFEANIREELSRKGLIGDELTKRVYLAKKGGLAKYLRESGEIFTFGILNAIFKDALKARKFNEVFIGSYKMFHRIVPILMAPFYPVLAMIGYILGTTRAINKILIPLLPDSPVLVKRIIKISEGDIDMKDRFSRAFVGSDNIVSALKPEIVHKFSVYLSSKMDQINRDDEVPDNYVENELKEYINREFNINPPIQLK